MYITVLSIWMILGGKAIQCCILSAIADGIIVIISAVFNIGISGVITSVVSIVNRSENNFFEVHELTFAIGLILIYLFFFSGNKYLKKRYIVFLSFLFILGDKRIAWGAILAAALFSFLVKRKGLSKKMLASVGIAGVCICYIYIFIIYNDSTLAVRKN